MAAKPEDEKDFEIVRLLMDDAWLTQAQIGERVNLSPSAVQRRIERLRASGVITGARATIDPSALQKPTRLYLLLDLNDDSKASLEDLVNSLKQSGDIVSADLLAGAHDILLTVDCDDIEAFFDYAMKSLNENRNVRHCSTLTRIRRLLWTAQ